MKDTASLRPPVVCFNPMHATKPGSVGLAVPDVEAKVVKDDGSEAGCREVGELSIRGPNVMLGYYGLPVESAEALKDGWLYTGDLAYLDEEDYIFIVDRKRILSSSAASMSIPGKWKRFFTSTLP